MAIKLHDICIKGWIHKRIAQHEWEEDGYVFYSWKSSEQVDLVPLVEYTIELTIPFEDDTIIQTQVAALEKQKLDALKDYTAAVTDIDLRLSKLLCLEHTS
jgi:hypothetical protein